MMTIEDLTVGYGDRVLLEHLSFELRRGEVFAIMGGSGCGKSTLLRTLIGLQPPLRGKIGLAPEIERAFDASTSSGRGLAPPFGVMFQSGALFGSLDLVENVALPLRQWTALDARSIEDVAAAKLALVGLSGFERFLPSEISGGMKKRAGIARALALDAPMIFLDEPSAGLDPISASELDDLMLALADDLDRAVVLVSHDLQSILRVGHRGILLDRDSKSIIAASSPRFMRDEAKDPRVKSFFARDFGHGVQR